jgi:hypothetical protein
MQVARLGYRVIDGKEDVLLRNGSTYYKETSKSGEGVLYVDHIHQF